MNSPAPKLVEATVRPQTLAPIRSLDWAALVLSELMLEADNRPELTDDFVSSFKAAAATLAEKIDRRRALDLEIQSKVKITESLIKALRDRKGRLEELKERNRRQVQEAMEAAPEVPFLDSAKRPIRLQKNPPSVAIMVELHDKAFSGIITDSEIEKHAIPEEFLEGISFRRLRVDAVRAAVKSGLDLPWTEMTQGQHTRGWDKIGDDDDSALASF